MIDMSQCCPLCGGRKASGKTTFTVDYGVGILVVRHVPALVCELCGEAWIEDSVADQLETIVEEARNKRIAVEVAEWEERVAA
jgi:YgiT-type zinc finger domain-containing protein